MEVSDTVMRTLWTNTLQTFVLSLTGMDLPGNGPLLGNCKGISLLVGSGD